MTLTRSIENIFMMSRYIPKKKKKHLDNKLKKTICLFQNTYELFVSLLFTFLECFQHNCIS